MYFLLLAAALRSADSNSSAPSSRRVSNKSATIHQLHLGYQLFFDVLSVIIHIHLCLVPLPRKCESRASLTKLKVGNTKTVKMTGSQAIQVNRKGSYLKQIARQHLSGSSTESIRSGVTNCWTPEPRLEGREPGRPSLAWCAWGSLVDPAEFNRSPSVHGRPATLRQQRPVYVGVCWGYKNLGRWCSSP